MCIFFKADVDYSTIERDYTGKHEGNDNNALSRDSTMPVNERDTERKSLTGNKRFDNLSNEPTRDINTRNIKGPNIFKPTDLNLIDPQDLPNIDIGYNQSSVTAPNKTSSQRSIQNNASINIPSYQNQLDIPYENQFVPRPSTTGSKNSSMRDPNVGPTLPPPPNRGPNKIQFPSKQGQQPNQGQQQPRYISSKSI